MIRSCQTGAVNSSGWILRFSAASRASDGDASAAAIRLGVCGRMCGIAFAFFHAFRRFKENQNQKIEMQQIVYGKVFRHFQVFQISFQEPVEKR
jgi:hypothetical protein